MKVIMMRRMSAKTSFFFVAIRMRTPAINPTQAPRTYEKSILPNCIIKAPKYSQRPFLSGKKRNRLREMIEKTAETAPQVIVVS